MLWCDIMHISIPDVVVVVIAVVVVVADDCFDGFSCSSWGRV